MPRHLACATLLALVAAAVRTPAVEPVAHLTSEPPFAATLDSIDSGGNVTFRAGNKFRVVAAKELAWWGHYRDSEAGPQFVLHDGSAIRADLLQLDDASLVIGDATGLGRGLWEQSTIPRRAVRAIVWQPPAGAADRDALARELQGGDARTDRLWLVDGETLGGTLIAAPLDGPFLAEGARPDRQVFTWHSPGQAEPLAVPAARVRAVQFAAIPAAQSSRPTLWIGCKDGSLVQASSVAAAGDQLSIKLVAGGQLVTPLAHRFEEGATFWSDVTWLHASGGDCRWLADLPTLGYKHIPFLTGDWPYENDRNAAGGRLRAGGAVFPKGLGMHSTSRLAYDVSVYRRFEAELAIDESAGRRGSAIYKVLLYGAGAAPAAWTTAYESPVLRGGAAPVPVSLELGGATRLALIVEFADRGDELDLANWLGARLFK